MALTDVNPYSWYENWQNAAPSLGWQYRDEGDYSRWVQPGGGAEGANAYLSFDDNRDPIGIDTQKAYRSDLAKQGYVPYSSMDELQHIANVARDAYGRPFYGDVNAFINYGFGPGSEIVQDPVHGLLVKAGNPQMAMEPSAVIYPQSGGGGSFLDQAFDWFGNAGPLLIPNLIVPGFGLGSAFQDAFQATELGQAATDITRLTQQGLGPEQIKQAMDMAGYNLSPETISSLTQVGSVAAPVLDLASSAYNTIADPLRSAANSVGDTIKDVLAKILPEYQGDAVQQASSIANQLASSVPGAYEGGMMSANSGNLATGTMTDAFPTAAGNMSDLPMATPPTVDAFPTMPEAVSTPAPLPMATPPTVDNWPTPTPTQTATPIADQIARQKTFGGQTISSYDPDAEMIAAQAAYEKTVQERLAQGWTWNMDGDLVPPAPQELPMATPPAVDTYPTPTPEPLPMATLPTVDAYPSPTPEPLPMATPPTVDKFPELPSQAPAELPMATPPTVDNYPDPTPDPFPTVPAELPMAEPPPPDKFPDPTENPFPVTPAELPPATPPTTDKFPDPTPTGTGITLPPGLTDIAKQLATGAGVAAITDAIAGGGNSTVDPSAGMAAAEDARQAAKRAAASKIKGAFSGFDDDYYNGVAQSYKDFQNPLLDEQYGEAARRLPLRFARTDNSSFARNRANLTRDYTRAQADIGKQAEDVANQQRQSVENSRSNLLQQAEAGAGLDDAAELSAQAARAVSAPKAFNPIADMFSKYTGDLANATLARNYGYNNPNTGARPLTFSNPRRSYTVTY